MKKSLSKIIKFTLLILIISLSFSACSGQKITEDGLNISNDSGLLGNSQAVNGTNEDGFLLGEGTNGEVENDKLESAGKTDPNDTSYSGYLGYGYNIVTGPYYCKDGIKLSYPIIDTDKLDNEKLIERVTENNNNVDGDTMVAESAQSYSKQLSEKAKIEADIGFTGSLKTSFKRDYKTQTNTNQRFITTHAILVKENEYILGVDADLLADYTTNAFKKNVSKMTANQLINTYGTHVLTDISLGGRFDINYFYTSSESSVTTNIKASAEASYRNIKGSMTGNDNETREEVDSRSEFKVLTYGGSLTVDPSSPEKAMSSYKEWSKAVEDGNLAFVNATNNIPLWDVVANLKDVDNASQKSKEIKKAFDDLVESTKGEFEDPVYAPRYISEILVGYGKKPYSAKNMLLSKEVLESDIIDLDLNKGARGEYIYLGYKTTYNKEEAITDIIAEHYNDSQSKDLTYDGNKYKIVPVDLNKGAGGKYIYLYYTKDKDDVEPITSIQYNHKGTWQYKNGNGYKPIKPYNKSDALDLNKGAGGDYVWLYFKRASEPK